MSLESVKQYFKSLGRENDIREFSQSSATVELAAQAVGTAPARIAKTLSFYSKEKDHAIFGMKAKMLAKEDVEPLTGHGIGGVCPFANPSHTEIYLDQSLKRFETVFPAAGSGNSAIELTCSELEKYTSSKDWIDVCKPMDQ